MWSVIYTAISVHYQTSDPVLPTHTVSSSGYWVEELSDKKKSTALNEFHDLHCHDQKSKCFFWLQQTCFIFPSDLIWSDPYTFGSHDLLINTILTFSHSFWISAHDLKLLNINKGSFSACFSQKPDSNHSPIRLRSDFHLSCSPEVTRSGNTEPVSAQWHTWNQFVQIQSSVPWKQKEFLSLN